MVLFFTLNREDFSFVIHLDRQPRTSRRREAQTGSRARSGSRSERTLDAVEHSRTLMEWWPFLIFHRGGLRIKVINNTWAFRGFNPHRKKSKSYYPLFAHLAQTGQILKSRNRPGNVHDSRGADAFLRELIGELQGRFGRSRKLEFRMDAAFFNEKILKRLERSRCEFAIKAPFWPWLGLKELVAGRKRWHRVSDGIDGFSIKHFIKPCNITVRIVIYRKRVRHRTAKNFQLDLFSPDDGYFEYSAVATNKSLTVQRLWYFAAGRGAQEKTFAELRSQFALDVVPTKSYAANSAWQQLNVLAHNLCRSFQLDTIAETKSISRKRTCTHLLHTIRTIRFRVINKAGRLVRLNGRNALRMATNSTTQTLFEKLELALVS